MTKLLSFLLIPSIMMATVFTQAPSITKRNFPQTSSKEVYSFHHAIKDAVACVVNISTTKQNHNVQSPLMMDPFFRDFFGRNFQGTPKKRQEHSLGSGVIISNDGYIVTNNHVIKDATKIMVSLPNDKKEYEAKLIGSDPKSDIAVIKIDAKNLPSLSIANSKELYVGDLVFAIGNPFGVGETVTQGIISALERNGVGINEYEDFIQTDASINPGNSGGALIDSRGFLVGINTAIISRGGGNNGVGFAIPSNMVMQVVNALITHGSVKRGLLGISIENISEKLYDFYNHRNGAVINYITPNSAAHKAGLKLGDLIIKVNDKDIESASELKNVIGSFSPGSTVLLKVVRNKRIIFIKAILQSADSIKENLSQLGLELQDLTPQIRNSYHLSRDYEGVLIEALKSNTPAQQAGLQSGDIITQLESERISSIEDFKKAWKRYKGLKKKRLYVYRNGYNLLAVIQE